MRTTRIAALGCAALLALGAAACGGSSDNGGGSGDQRAGDGGGGTQSGAEGIADTYVLGTTDKVVALDPAGAYDLGSQQLIGNLYQNLLSMPAGGNKPQPDAAESCEFTNKKTYTCTLKSGLKFSNGDPLTAKDVKFTFERQLKIADPSGASSLLGSMKSVAAPDPQTVVFHLSKPDATWPFILTHTVAAIVPSKVFPFAKEQPDGKVIGSGPYQLERYQPNQQAVFKINPNYAGPNKGQTQNVIVQYYEQPSALKLAIEQGDVDIAYRSLSPTDIEALRDESGRGVKVVDGAGTEIRYIVFNVSKPPVDKVEVRRAIAQVLDRQKMTDSIYKGTAKPLYSTVPAALPGAEPTFQDAFGDPDVDKAKALLQKAGVQIPVQLDGWYTPTHYGPVEVDLWNEIKRQLEASGLFKMKLDSTEWDAYKEAAFDKHQYYMYGLGWFPDYPDGDNYLAPFMRDGGFFQNSYSSKAVDAALDTELASSDEDVRVKQFKQVQEAQAKDVPLIPLWEGKQVAAVRDGVEGVDKTFDPAFQFRFWLVTKQS